MVTKDLIENDKEFNEIISGIISNDTVLKMKNFRQHCDTSCFDHCLTVSYYSYIICKKLRLDYVSVARAAMVHDLFLYDWRFRQKNRTGLHAFTHPKEAFKNASELFDLNDKEKDIILKHMWPVTLVPPKYLESYIITFVDKYCALSETNTACREFFSRNKISRYAYVFLCFLIFKII